MTAREARNRRRAAERKAEKLARKAAPNAEASVETRAEINRANSQLSTGPRTPQGKTNSSRNSFKHGLYSKQLIIDGEDPAEFDALRADLRAEHGPASTTEEILVDELAQHFWRMRRFRALEARAWSLENLDTWLENGLLSLIQRSMASAERAFHKALAALKKIQKERGFVPAKSETEKGGLIEAPPSLSPSLSPEARLSVPVFRRPAAADSGFVPAKTVAFDDEPEEDLATLDAEAEKIMEYYRRGTVPQAA